MELLTPEELEKVTAEMQREVDELQAWLHSPEGEAWVDQQLREADEMALDFQRACAAGKYELSPDEIEQLLADGELRKCHPIKRDYPSAALEVKDV